jgi:hypothetical protein
MHSPYRDDALDRLYNSLFCDQPLALPAADGLPSPAWQRALTSGPAFAGALRRLAEDRSGDARVRALACRQLQRNGHVVTPRVLLGVVLEMPVDDGLDTLAAYVDGSICLLRSRGRTTPLCRPTATQSPLVQALLAAARGVVGHDEPGRQARPAPPQRHVRLSCIVSDGLTVREGPLARLFVDPQVGPVLQHALGLLDEMGEPADLAAA